MPSRSQETSAALGCSHLVDPFRLHTLTPLSWAGHPCPGRDTKAHFMRSMAHPAKHDITGIPAPVKAMGLFLP